MGDVWAEYVHIRQDLHMWYGDVVGERLYLALVAAIEKTEDHCIDNFRFARQANADEVAKYEYKRDNGCCGFVDEEAMIEGEIFLYGFNYGH